MGNNLTSGAGFGNAKKKPRRSGALHD